MLLHALCRRRQSATRWLFATLDVHVYSSNLLWIALQQPPGKSQPLHVRCFARHHAGWYRPPDPKPPSGASTSALVSNIANEMSKAGSNNLAMLMDEVTLRAPTIGVMYAAQLIGVAGKLAHNRNLALRNAAKYALRALANTLESLDANAVMPLASPSASGVVRSLFSGLSNLNVLDRAQVNRLADNILGVLVQHVPPADLVACLEFVAPALGCHSCMSDQKILDYLLHHMPSFSLQSLSSLSVYEDAPLYFWWRSDAAFFVTACSIGFQRWCFVSVLMAHARPPRAIPHLLAPEDHSQRAAFVDAIGTCTTNKAAEFAAGQDQALNMTGLLFLLLGCIEAYGGLPDSLTEDAVATLLREAMGRSNLHHFGYVLYVGGDPAYHTALSLLCVTHGSV